MWDNILLPFLLSSWPMVAVIVGVAVVIFLLRYVLINSKLQSILSAIISSEVAIVAVFGEKAEEVIAILKQVQEAIVDQNLSVEEAQKLAENMAKKALEELGIQVTIIHWAILKFVLGKLVEAIVIYRSKEVASILSNMEANVKSVKIQMASF